MYARVSCARLVSVSIRTPTGSVCMFVNSLSELQNINSVMHGCYNRMAGQTVVPASLLTSAGLILELISLLV